ELAHLPGNVAPAPGAAVAIDETRIEYPIDVGSRHAVTVIKDFQVRLPGALETAGAQLDTPIGGVVGVLHGVVAQVPEHLPQVARVHEDLELRRHVEQEAAFVDLQDRK